MSISCNKKPSVSASDKFAEVSRTPQTKSRKRPAPLSLRLSPEEWAALEKAADGMSLSRYIKGRIFDAKDRPKPSRRPQPVKDHAALARALGLLGNLRLANNLNLLAKAVNMGTLPVSREVEEELMATCAAVLAIRMELMRALGYPVEEDQ